MGDEDQAARLRQLVNEQEGNGELAPRSGNRARVIAVTSGKGGVGKTNVATNVAIAISSLGFRVAVVDADYSLANIDILLGLNPRYTIEHVLKGQKSIGEVIVQGPGGVRIVPAASGMQYLSNLTTQQQNKLFNSLQILEKHFQHLIIDTAAGIADNVISLLRSADDVLVVTNPEPPAFVDSYALIKHLLTVCGDAAIRLVVNSVAQEQEARKVFERISVTIHRFLKKKIGYLGYVLEDGNVRKAVRSQRPFILQFPNSPASRCVKALARKQIDGVKASKDDQEFWKKLKHALGT